jgi:hypothetical protein
MIEHDGCVGCKYEHEDEASPHCDKCTQNSTDKYMPVSNADRIRGMSDEELARWLVDATVCERVCHEDEYCHGNECVKLVTEWLQQPAKEEA